MIRARRIKFTDPVRTGPNAQHHMVDLDLSDGHFAVGVTGEDGHRIGTIEIDMEKRFVRIRSPQLDRGTMEPIEVIVPMERVVSYEPLTPAQAAVYYPHEHNTSDGSKFARAQPRLA